MQRTKNLFLYQSACAKENWYYIFKIILSFLLGSYLWKVLGTCLIYIFLPSLLKISVINIISLFLELIFGISGFFFLCGYKKIKYIFLLYATVKIMDLLLPVIIITIKTSTLSVSLINCIYLLFYMFIVLWVFKDFNKTGEKFFIFKDKFLIILSYLLGSYALNEIKISTTMLLYGNLKITDQIVYFFQYLVWGSAIYIVIAYFYSSKLIYKVMLFGITLIGIYILIFNFILLNHSSMSVTINIIYTIVILIICMILFLRLRKANMG